MGCQTGYYLILQGEPDVAAVVDLIEATLTDVLEATEVPAANEVQCGWGENHSLEEAKEAARAFLAQRAVWEQVSA
jgi:S-ribosylhomocysteine lyase